MPATCLKEFALHVESGPSAAGYWTFDSGPPFTDSVDGNDFTGSGAAISNPAGLLNNALRFSGMFPFQAFTLTTGVTDDFTMAAGGWTFTTWINFAALGSASALNRVASVIFRDVGLNVILQAALDMQSVNPRVTLTGGAPFTQFNTADVYSMNRWHLVRLQFDSASKKIGIQRANTVDGVGVMEESASVVIDLSQIIQGELTIAASLGGIAGSQDWRQDETGFWNRLLTDDEFLELFNSGTPPAYPAIP